MDAKTLATIPLTVWLTEQPTGEVTAELTEDDSRFGSMQINDVMHHITLVQVEVDDDGNQVALSDWGDNCLAAARQFESTDDDFATIEHEGRRFVCVVTPFLR